MAEPRPAEPRPPVWTSALEEDVRVRARPVVVAWIASRTVLLGTLLVTAAVTGRGMIGVLGNWDVAHFARIAHQGYAPDHQEMAFFPGLPLLMRLGSTIGLPPEVTGALLSLAASALAAAALVRLAGGRAGGAGGGAGETGGRAGEPGGRAGETGGRAGEPGAAGTWATVAWLIAPTAVFTVVGYTEALFCAAAFWAWERARADRWAAAAVLAALATTLRVSGLFLIGALVVLALTWPGARGKDLGRRLGAAASRAVWMLVPLAVLVAYVVYLWTLTGSWTAWFAAQQEGWQRTFTWPWESVRATLIAVRPGGYADANGWGWIFRYELVSFTIGLLTTGWMLRRRRWAEASWVGVQLLAFSFSPWLMSVNRAVLLWFPTWAILGELAARLTGRRSAGGRETGAIARRGVETTRRSLGIERDGGTERDGGVADDRTRPYAGRLLVGLAAAVSIGLMVWWAWMFATGQWAS